MSSSHTNLAAESSKHNYWSSHRCLPPEACKLRGRKRWRLAALFVVPPKPGNSEAVALDGRESMESMESDLAVASKDSWLAGTSGEARSAFQIQRTPYNLLVALLRR